MAQTSELGKDLDLVLADKRSSPAQKLRWMKIVTALHNEIDADDALGAIKKRLDVQDKLLQEILAKLSERK